MCNLSIVKPVTLLPFTLLSSRHAKIGIFNKRIMLSLNWSAYAKFILHLYKTLCS